MNGSVYKWISGVLATALIAVVGTAATVGVGKQSKDQHDKDVQALEKKIDKNTTKIDENQKVAVERYTQIIQALGRIEGRLNDKK